MKFNWGYGITIFLIIFVLFTLGLLYKANQQNIDLVTTNYYEEELAFQELKDKKALAEKHFKKQITFSIENDTLFLKFPDEVTEKISGEITFFKPSDAKLDLKFEFENDTNLLHYPLNLFSNGMYKVRIDWQHNNNEYYNELTIKL